MINIALSSLDHQGDMAPNAASPAGAGGVPSVSLTAGHSLYSPGGAFRLTFLAAAGVVIQCVDDSTLQWQSGKPLNPIQVNWITLWTGAGTTNRAITQMDMQADGNFVVYAGDVPIFSSQTDQNNLTSGAILRMQDDGNLVIYIGDNPKFSTGTYARSGGTLAQTA